MRGCPTVQLKQEGIAESETNPCVPHQEEQADSMESKVIADYTLDVYYKPEGADSESKPANHEKDEQNSNEEYVKMELPHQGTMQQR